MLKYIIRIFAVLAALLVITFVALSVFLATIDPNDYKDRIETAAGAALKLPVSIGDIKLESFPVLHLTLQDASIGNPQGFTGNLFEAEKITAGISIIPLLKRQLEIGNITVEQPKINLITARNGNSNWDTLTAAAETADKSAAAAPAALAVSRITMDRATLRWQNLQDDKDWRADKLDLAVGALIPGQKTDLALKAEIREHRSGNGADVGGQLTVTLNLENRIIDIADFDLSLKLHDKTAQQYPPVRINGTAAINLKSDTVKFPSLLISQEESMLKAAITVSELSQNPAGQFDFTEGRLTPELLKTLNRIADISIPHTVGTISFSGKGLFNTATEQVRLDTFALSADGFSVAGKGDLGNFSANPVIHFDIAESEIKAKHLSPVLNNDIFKMLSPEISKIHFSGKGSLNIAAEDVQLNQINMSAEGFSVKGAVGVRNYSKVPSIYARGAINATVLDLDLDTAENKRGASSARTEQQTDLSQAPALALYEKLDADVDISISKLKTKGIVFNEVRAKILGKNKDMKISLSPLSAFGGKFKGEFSASLKGETLHWQALGDADDLSVQELLKFTEFDKKIALQGRLDLDYALNANGIGGQETRRSLSGNAKLSMQDAKLDNSGLANSIEHALAYFEKRRPEKNSRVLTIDSLTANIKISEGQAVNRDLNMNTPLLHIRGEGWAKLTSNTLDYRLLTGSFKQKEAERIYIPIRISGTFDKPEYRVEFEKIVKDTAKKKVREKVQEKIQEKVGDVLEKILKLPL